jgi:hypothetical protein
VLEMTLWNEWKKVGGKPRVADPTYMPDLANGPNMKSAPIVTQGKWQEQ